jgi:hypothetical protein
MTGLSTYLRTKFLNYFLGTSVDEDLTILAISGHTADPGLAGASECPNSGGYARVSVSVPSGFNAPVIVGSDLLTDNVAAITFPQATGAGYTINFFGIWTSATYGAGNFLIGGDCTDAVMAAGESYRFDPGALDITIR